MFQGHKYATSIRTIKSFTFIIGLTFFGQHKINIVYWLPKDAKMGNWAGQFDADKKSPVGDFRLTKKGKEVSLSADFIFSAEYCS